ncbi:MAG: hypothetical protein ABIL16_00710 [candidate division WOR-3 bacterium]
MKRCIFVLPLLAGPLGAQLFYAYPQTVFGLRGVYSFRFMHTAFLFEDDLDRLFYPVKLSEIEGGRFFSALSNPFGNERALDPTAPTNNQLILGAKTNVFLNLSPLYMQTDLNFGVSSKLDTVYYQNWSNPDNKYADRIELKDTVFQGRGYGEKGFLLSLGNQTFGFLFLYSSMNIKVYPQRTGVFPFSYGNYAYVRKEYDNINNTLQSSDSAVSYRTVDTSITPVLFGVSLGFGGFSGMVFGGFMGAGDRDTANRYAERNTNPASPFTGQKWNGVLTANGRASGPIFGLQGDLAFGSETWKSNLMFAYALRYLSNGKGKSNEVNWWGIYNATQYPTFSTLDSTIGEYKYSSNTHDITIYLRNKYPVHEQVLFGAGLALEMVFGGMSRDYTNVLNKRITFNDTDGDGLVDAPGDVRTTNYTKYSYKENVSTTSFNYHIPVGFEVVPIASWEDVKLRLGALYSHTSTTTTTKTYNWSVESKTKTETSGGTTETPNDITVPGENISKTKTSISNTAFYYGASVAIAKRVVIDFTGFGNGILTPAFWNISVVLRY